MKYWGILVLVLYLLLLIIVLVPLSVFIFKQPSSSSVLQNILDSMRELFPLLKDSHSLADYSVWIYLGVVFLAQAAFLSVPVLIVEKRPVTKRSIIPLVAATSLMLGLLVFGVALAISEVVRGEIGFSNRDLFIMLAVSFLMWGFWASVFYRWSKTMETRKLVGRQCNYLFKGSILELLIAVPAHILVRQRTYCCAGMNTFLGIAFGVSVMLFCLGPGIFFLFVERLKHLHRKR